MFDNQTPTKVPVKTITKTKIDVSSVALLGTVLVTSTLLLGLFSALAATSLWRIAGGNAFGYETHDFLGIGEYGVVENLTHKWQTVEFLRAERGLPVYTSAPVVIAKPVGYNGGDPSHIRIKDVINTSFKLKVEEWAYIKNRNHTRETVSFIVIPVGTYDSIIGYPDFKIKAGKIDTSHQWQDIDLSDFVTSTPVILTQSQTFNGGDPIVTRNKLVIPDSAPPLPPLSQDVDGECSWAELDNTRCIYFDESHGGPATWVQKCTGVAWTNIAACPTYCVDGACINLTTTTTLKVRLQEEEAKGGHAQETVGFIAITPFSGVLSGGWGDLKLDVGTVDNVKHQWRTITFNQTFDQAPAFLADMQTFNGGDTAGLRYRNLDNDSVDIFVEEEDSKDNPPERNHVYETVGYIAFERPHRPVPHDAKISIATLKDIYGINELIKLTDPPKSAGITYSQPDYYNEAEIEGLRFESAEMMDYQSITDDYSIDYNKHGIKALPYEVKKKLQSLPAKRQAELNYELTNIKNGIKEKGVLWTANFNSKFILDDEEKEKLCGLKGSPPERKTEKSYKTTTKSDLPDFFDWREQHGNNYITDIRDQDGCGSCWAFASIAVLEGHVNAYYNNPGLDVDLSEQDLISCYLPDGCCGASKDQIELIFDDYWKNTGMATEESFLYEACDATDPPPCSINDCPYEVPCSSKLPGWEDAAWKILGYESVPLTVNDIKRAVIEKGPVEVGMIVYDDFTSYSGGIYYHVSDWILGYHAVTIVGFGKYDGMDYWIVKNSWGTDWGEDGYFNILTGDSIIDEWFAYAVTRPNPPVNQPQAVVCSDKDWDDYCSWGFSERPLLCDDEMEPLEEGFGCCPFRCLNNAEKDCDDNYYNDSTTINEPNCGKPTEATGILSITSNPSDAEVYVKDLISVPGGWFFRGNAPLEIELNIGEREVKVGKEDYIDEIESVIIHEDNETSLNVNLHLAPKITNIFNNDIFRPRDVLEIKGIVPDPDLENFVIEYKRSDLSNWSTAGITLTNGGTEPIDEEGVIAIWDTSGFEQNFYDLRLVANYVSDEIEIGLNNIYFDPSLKEGWPVLLSEYYGETGSYPYPVTIANIDSGEDKEIIVYGSHNVFVLKQDGTLLEGWPQKTGCFKGASGPTPAISVGDIDGDNENEILKTNFAWRGVYDEEGLYCGYCGYAWNPDGTEVDGWPIECEDYSLHNTSLNQGAFVLSDLNNDGILEIIANFSGVYQTYYPATLVLSGNGDSFSNWPFSYEPFDDFKPIFAMGTPAVGDVDCDGEKEVVSVVEGDKSGNRFLYVYILSSEGYLENVLPLGYSNTLSHLVVLADFDNDCDLEIVIEGTRFITIIHHTGEVYDGLWPLYYSQQLSEEFSAGKFNNDFAVVFGKFEKFEDNRKTTFTSLDINGNVIFDKLVEGIVWSQPVLLDITNNGSSEIFITRDYVYGFDIEGNDLENFPKKLSSISHSRVAIDDIDNDGILELVAADYSPKIYVWELDALYNPEIMHWPQFQHDPQHTGLYTPPSKPRPQSKIKNLDPKKDLEANLFVYVEKYEDGQWGSRIEVIEDYDIVVPPNDQLGIDTIFNRLGFKLGEVGIYQVCTELRDGSGTIIESVDGDLLEACWEFEVR